MIIQRNRYVYANPAFRQMTGYTLEDLPDTETWFRQAYPDPAYRTRALEAWGEAVQRAAASGADIPPTEFRVACKDGDLRLVEISGILLDDAHVLATFTDVTERRATERALSLPPR